MGGGWSFGGGGFGRRGKRDERDVKDERDRKRTGQIDDQLTLWEFEISDLKFEIWRMRRMGTMGSIGRMENGMEAVGTCRFVLIWTLVLRSRPAGIRAPFFDPFRGRGVFCLVGSGGCARRTRLRTGYFLVSPPGTEREEFEI